MRFIPCYADGINYQYFILESEKTMLYTNIFTSFHFPLFIMAVIISLSIISCSKTPDVRLTMCQDLTMMFLNSPETLEWKDQKPVMKGLDDLEMQISYSITQSDGQIVNDKASCFYKYEQDEIGAETFNTPTAAYSAYPNKMIFKGKVVDKKELANSVNKVMLNQGARAIIKVEAKLKGGFEKVNQEVKNQLGQ